MNKTIGVLRFFARAIATPLFIASFGLCWLGFVSFIAIMFQIFSFLQKEKFDYGEYVHDCNDFFREPLMELWS